MKLDTLPNAKDIREHPIHWRNYLRESKENSFVLFQYGPHIIMSTDPYDYEGGKCENDLLKMMAIVRSLIHSCWASTDKTPYAQKADIRHVLRNCNQYPYSDTIRKIAEGLYKIVTERHTKKTVMENTIMQISPIEEYSMSLKKDLPVWGDLINRLDLITEDMLIEFLTTPEYLVQILGEPPSFIDLDESTSRIIDLLSESPTISKIYYIMVWLYTKQCLGKSPDILIRFNEIFNKIINGESYDIDEALITFCNL